MTETMWPAESNYLLPGFLQQAFANPCSRELALHSSLAAVMHQPQMLRILKTTS